MNELAVDVEATIHNKGSPHDPRNFLVCYSVATNAGASAVKWDNRSIPNLQALANCSSVLVGFNFKYDLHWLIKHGLVVNVPVWDVQLAEFILSNQTNRFPSLAATCEKYGISKKLDVVATEYWDKGINTDQIPWEVLEEYSESVLLK